MKKIQQNLYNKKLTTKIIKSNLKSAMNILPNDVDVLDQNKNPTTKLDKLNERAVNDTNPIMLSVCVIKIQYSFEAIL